MRCLADMGAHRLVVEGRKHVIDRLSRVLADSSAALTEGAIVIVEEGRHRVRRFDEG